MTRQRRYRVQLFLPGGIGYPYYDVQKTVWAESMESAVEVAKRATMRDFHDRPFQVREARVRSVEVMR